MPDLTKEAASMLYPVLQILGLLIVTIGTLVLALWRGFRWLQGQITSTAEAMLAPIVKKVNHNEASVRKAHIRISRLRSDLSLTPDHYDDYEVESEHA